MILKKVFYISFWILAVFCKSSYTTVLPQKPGNISCFSNDELILNCSWATGRETNPDTTYVILKRGILQEHNWNLEDKSVVIPSEFWTKEIQKGNCSKETFSCSVKGVALVYSNYCVQVKAKDSFGEVESECILQNSKLIFKPRTPQIMKLEPIPGMKQMLKVFWGDLKLPYPEEITFQIRYRTAKENSMKNVTFCGHTTWTSFNLTGLWDFANYTVALRLKIKPSRVWSEWSADKMGTTEEQAPLKVDLWRVIDPHQSFGTRTVHLMWKKCEEFPSSGIVNGYIVKYFKEGNVSFQYLDYNETFTSLSLTEEAHEVSVIAHNIAGDSPEATLRIPSVHEESKGHQIILNLNVSVSNNQATLEWKTSDLEIDGYIIEWYDELETNPLNRFWKKVANVTKWLPPQGTFARFTCYIILVYPLQRGEIKAPISTTTYLEEGRPSEGPVVTTSNVDKNEATVKWKEVPKAKRNGIILSYTILCSDASGKKLEKIVDASVLQYQLTSLKADTTYTVSVMANTTRGGTNGPSTSFTTKSHSAIDIIFINVLIGGLILCLLAVTILWLLKRQTLKRICWPKIPHPVILDCPDSFQEIMVRKSLYDDETLISILQVEAHSKEYRELPLQHLERPIRQTNGTAKDEIYSHEISHSGGQEAVKSLPQIPSPEYFFKHLMFPVTEQVSKVSENKEEHDQADLNNSEFCPYLKNSVPIREFLTCHSSDNTKKPKEAPVAMSTQPYVSLDTFDLFSKHS